MKSGAKAKYLVVDTTGFIKNLQFQELAENVITLEDVTNEIKCHKQLKRLAVLPYDLTIKSVFPENIKTVSEFSKKTGDYPSLSAVDMKVMALTYQLEKEHVGIDHLKTTPEVQTTVENYNPSEVLFDNVAGFYNKDKEINKVDEKSLADDSELIIHNMKVLDVCDEDEVNLVDRTTLPDTPCDDLQKELPALDSLPQEKNNDETGQTEESVEQHGTPCEQNNPSCNSKFVEGSETYPLNEKGSPTTPEKEDVLSASPPDDKIEMGYSSDDEGDSLSDGNLQNDDDFNLEDFQRSDDFMILKRVDQSTLESGEISDDDSIYDDDECGWITPNNITQAKRETNAGLLSDEHVTVACLTTDFAMQNVLLQMGLNVMAVDGRIIKQVRTYILRCHACGKTTSIMTKIFCPKCGLKTLRRVAVSVDPEGKQHIYINYRRQITAKGKRWSIPKPQGGKHANNPILVEDQRIPQQRLSKKAMQRTNALDPDYIAGFSPFVMRDTTSRSVMLGFHTSRQNIKHLVGRTPHKRNGKKKK